MAVISDLPLCVTLRNNSLQYSSELCRKQTGHIVTILIRTQQAAALTHCYNTHQNFAESRLDTLLQYSRTPQSAELILCYNTPQNSADSRLDTL
ncbi:Hypothetical predicted protein [Pelobates cultripes]|uniref:Uncharacterized protein n=1 Tax=Pelobates cultripes TaxID=61616 RepID=A0AAD1S3F1_PELCU|nr:Hypothetical predicted protein [Pelobates cultripes]